MGVTGLVFLILFFALGGDNQFGILNDISSGMFAILSGILASVLYSSYRENLKITGLILLAGAWIGVLVVLLGSVLVIFHITGWVLAGFYSVTGFAILGLWLIGLNFVALRSGLLPRRLAIYGIICGLIMQLGYAAVPGICARIDSYDGLPAFLNVLWQVAGLGSFLFMFWCLGLYRSLVRR